MQSLSNPASVYLHSNFCGLGDRLVVHPKGLPPGWYQTNVEPETVERVKAAVPFPLHHVVHLNPVTLEVVETFPLR